MRYRTHQSLTLMATTGLILAVPAVKNLAMPVPMILSAALTGSGLVDLDIYRYDRGHRMRSPFHTVETPLIFILATFISALLLTPVSGTVSRLIWLAFFFSVGWFFHLSADFIQGGIKSRLLKKKIGIKSFTWDKYDSFLGHLMDGIILILGIFCGMVFYLRESDLSITNGFVFSGLGEYDFLEMICWVFCAYSLISSGAKKFSILCLFFWGFMVYLCF